MAQFFVHIGYPKTGTTALQHFFYDHRQILMDKYDIYYPVNNTLEKCHHTLTWCFFNDKEKQHPSIKQFFNRLTDKQVLQNFIDEINNYIKSKPNSKILISSEYFILCPDTLKNFIELLQTQFPESKITIVVYIRRQDEFFESSYAYHVGIFSDLGYQGYIEDFIRYPLILQQANYYNKIKNITTTYKGINIRPLIYGKKFFYDNNLFKDFFMRVFNIHDINTSTDISYLKNVSLKGESILALRKLREEFEIHSSLAQEIYNYLRKIDNYEENKLKNLLTLKDRLHILDYYKEFNDILFEEFFKSDNQWILSKSEISNYESIEKYHIEHSDEIEKTINEKYNKAKQKLFEMTNMQKINKSKFIINDWGYMGIHGRITKISDKGIEGWILDVKNLQPLTYQIYIEGMLAIEKQAEGDPKKALKFFSIDKFVPCGINFKWKELASNSFITDLLFTLPPDKILDISVVEKSTQKGIRGDYFNISTNKLCELLCLKQDFLVQ